MREVYGLYYDFGTHIICEYGIDLRNENSIEEWVEKIKETSDENEKAFINSIENYCEYNTVFNIIPSGYHGIVSESNESNEIRLESIPKGKSPIILMSYNKDGYTTHCKDYRDYKEWERKRNPIRYESNLNQNYDGKNMCHAMRLMRMGKELAMGQGFNVERTYDRKFLLDIKNHKFEYDEIISKVEQEQLDMDVAAAKSNLKEVLDYNEINELLIKARNFIYETKKGE
jgi:hypothetical protein